MGFWFWLPFGSSLGFAAFYGLGAWAFEIDKDRPRYIDGHFFEGPLRAIFSVGVIAIILALFPVLSNPAVRNDPVLFPAFKAAAIVMVIGGGIGIYLYSSVGSLRRNSSTDQVEIRSPLLVTLKGVLYGLSISLLIPIMISLLFSPLFSTPDPSAASSIEEPEHEPG